MTDIELEIALLSDKVWLAFDAGDSVLMRRYADEFADHAGLAAEDGQDARAAALSELAAQTRTDARFIEAEHAMTTGANL
jgi:hypothetical protein